MEGVDALKPASSISHLLKRIVAFENNIQFLGHPVSSHNLPPRTPFERHATGTHDAHDVKRRMQRQPARAGLLGSREARHLGGGVSPTTLSKKR